MANSPYRPLRVLWVATKTPLPPIDGGRLLQLRTLEQLARRRDEVEVDLIAPLFGAAGDGVETALMALCRPELVEARPRPLPVAVLLSLLRGLPVTAVRHSLSAVRRRVLSSARTPPYDVVHAEQVQAMPQALAAGAPVVLRTQNVESDLWRGEAARGPGWLARREGARVARWEGQMVRRAALALAVSCEDAQRLSRLAGGASVEVLPVPFPGELPPGPPLPGAPAVTLLVGTGWRPNRQGAERFVAEGWPMVRSRLPGAVLHVFGDAAVAGEGVVRHAPPSDSAGAFPAGGVLVVPLWAGSGVRVKVLEAWARGVPVVATPVAASGLGATAGDELLVGATGEELAAALVSVAGDAELSARLRAAGRSRLASHHDAARIADALLARYRAVADGPAPPS